MVRLKYIIKHKARDIKFKIDVIRCFFIIAYRDFMKKPNIK